MNVNAVCRWRFTRVLGGVAALALLTVAPIIPSNAADDIWQRDKLTGDWGGARTEASKHGIDFTFNYIGETLGVLSGGFRQGADYEHRFEFSIDTDLDKMFGWSGASAHTTFYQIGHANGLPAADYVGSIADPSNIEAQPATRLFTAWFQKNFFDDKISLRVGQIAADDEFLISPTASNLIASTFGYATILAANQLQGGPVYPLATPGIRLQLKPNDEITVLSAVFSGAPAGANCVGLPQQCDPYGTTFSLSGGALFMEELQYGINQATRRLQAGRLVRDHQLRGSAFRPRRDRDAGFAGIAGQRLSARAPGQLGNLRRRRPDDLARPEGSPEPERVLSCRRLAFGPQPGVVLYRRRARPQGAAPGPR